MTNSKFKPLLTIVYLISILLAFNKIYDVTFRTQLDLNGDNAAYYILGKALANGEGYRNVHHVEAEPHRHFPPGYPAIISVAMRLGQDSVMDIKKLNGVFLLLSLVLIFFLVRKLYDDIHLAFLTSLFVLFNINLLRSSSIMMSEIPFLFFSLLSIFLLLSADLSRKWWSNHIFILGILAAVIAYYIRSVGVALVVSAMGYFLLKKKWSYVFSSAGISFGLVLPWMIRNRNLGGGSYGDQIFYINPYKKELGRMEFGDWFTRVWENLTRYITKEIPAATVNEFKVPDYDVVATATDWVIGLLMAGIIAFALWRLKRQLLTFYVLATFGVLLLWPDVWFGTRFIQPLIPFFTIFILSTLLLAVKLILTKLNMSKWLTYSSIGFTLVGLLALKPYYSMVDELGQIVKQPLDERYVEYFTLANHMRTVNDPNVLVVCRKQELFYVISNKKTILYKNTKDPQEQIEYFKEKGVTHVILDRLGFSSTADYLFPAMQSDEEKFQIIKELGDEHHSYLTEFHPELGYEGEWKDNQRSGYGIYKWKDGNRFEGEWANNIRNGKGRMFVPSGEYMEGTWENDKAVGPYIIYTKDGKIIRTGFAKKDEVVTATVPASKTN